MFLKVQKITLASFFFLSKFQVISKFDESLAWLTGDQSPWMLTFVTKKHETEVKCRASWAEAWGKATDMFDRDEKKCEFHYVQTYKFLP